MDKFLIIFIVIAANFWEINGHGKVMDPVNRGSAWRKKYRTPINWNDNENYCGGFAVQYSRNKGRCGVCGDSYSDKQPRANENTGRYGTGTIVKSYEEGEQIQVEVQLSTNHRGAFQFQLCPLKDENDIETEECFNEHPVKLANGDDKYVLMDRRIGSIKIDLVLPKGLTCQHCSFRWNWRVANSWGICPDGRGAIGCGNQETYRSCSDIAILPKK